MQKQSAGREFCTREIRERFFATKYVLRLENCQATEALLTLSLDTGKYLVPSGLPNHRPEQGA